MTFVAPLWLLGLIPWTALVAWILVGRRERAEVPYLPLWQSRTPMPRPAREFRVPPTPIICLLLATLLSALAASRPVATLLPQAVGPKITIIVDRGLTMSTGGESTSRLAEAVQTARAPLLRQFGDGPTDVILIPDGAVTLCDRQNWSTLAVSAAPAPVDTRRTLLRHVRQALADTDGPVVVITDQDLPADSDRLVVIPPASRFRNVGITAVSAADSAAPQIMLRLRNDSSLNSATVTIAGAAHRTSQQVSLPPAGGERNYFFDLPALERTFRVIIDADDDQPADNHADLRLVGAWPSINVQGELPAALVRMIDVYRDARPATDASAPLLVTSQAAGEGFAAVIVPGAGTRPADPTIQALAHPINASVIWPASLADAVVGPAPRDNWQPVLKVGGQTVVAVREKPARQVWIALWSDEFARQGSFVVFWSNVLDWAGGGDPRWDAQFVAAIPAPPARNEDWQARLGSMPPRFWAGMPLASPLILLALGLILLAVLLCATCKNCASR